MTERDAAALAHLVAQLYRQLMAATDRVAQLEAQLQKETDER